MHEDQHIEALYPAHSREREISELLSYVITGDSCQLIGMPGVGREDVFGLLSYNRNVRIHHLGEKQTAYHFVFVNFAEVRERPFVDVIKLFLYSLSHSLQDRGMDGAYEYTKGILEKSIAVHDDLIVAQALKDVIRFLAFDKKLTIVLLLNRFEHYVPTLTTDLFILLESLHAIAEGKFSSVFSLTRPLEQTIDISLFREVGPLLTGNDVHLSVSDEPSIMFRIKHTAEQFNSIIPTSLIDDIIQLTGGHRKMTKRAIEEFLRAGSSGVAQQVLDSSEKRQAQANRINELLLASRNVRSVSYEIWNSFLPEEQLFLKFQLTHQGEVITRTREEIRISKYLHDIHILLESRFTMPLFAEFVRYRVEHALDEKLAIEPHTGGVLKGELAITDKFTSLEYKLLRLFLENQEKLIDREELIQVVWGEMKTTEGVTDQAVDQLVFRLRSKIEENPSDPKLLLTVKGRGFQYQP